MYAYHIFSIHLLVVGHLGCFHFLAIVYRTAMNMSEQVSVEDDIESFGHMPTSITAGSCSRFIFRFLRVFYTDFQSAVMVYRPSNNE